MTSKDLIMAAVNRQTTPRVPITFDAEKEVYEALLDHFGLNSKEDIFDRLHVDTWMILPDGFMYAADQEGREEKMSLWGYKTKVTAYSGGAYDEVTYWPLAGKNEIREIEDYAWPCDDALGFGHFPSEAKAHKDRAIIGVFTWGAYFVASHVRGMEDLMMDFAMRKDYAHRLIERIEERMMHYLDTLLESCAEGVDIVYMADDYCSQRGPLFSPDTFREFVMPYLTRVAMKVHEHGKKLLLHCCGAVRPLLPMIIETGVDMLEPIQIRAEGMDPAGLKRDFGKDLCFYGGVDLQHVLCEGSPETVADEVKRLIDILGRDGGYILGPGHTYIQTDAPLENIVSMYDTAYEYR